MTILVIPAVVDNGIPLEAKIEKEVRDLKRGRAGGPSGMQVEGIKGWLWEATHEK